jgi:hypothetical protein
MEALPRHIRLLQDCQRDKLTFIFYLRGAMFSGRSTLCQAAVSAAMK